MATQLVLSIQGSAQGSPALTASLSTEAALPLLPKEATLFLYDDPLMISDTNDFQRNADLLQTCPQHISLLLDLQTDSGPGVTQGSGIKCDL